MERRPSLPHIHVDLLPGELAAVWAARFGVYFRLLTLNRNGATLDRAQFAQSLYERFTPWNVCPILVSVTRQRRNRDVRL